MNTGRSDKAAGGGADLGERPLLIGCGILKREIEAVILKNNWALDTLFLDSSLHVNFEKLSCSLISALAANRDREVVVLYGECHPLMDKLLSLADVTRIHGQNCVEMLLGRELFTRHLSQGAFFLLEEWARRWDAVVGETFSMNPEIARSVFQGDRKYILAVKTPCSGTFKEEAEHAAEKVGLPLQWIEASLDNLEKTLTSAVEAAETKYCSGYGRHAMTRRHSVLENRVANLAREKAQLQLINEIIRQLATASGLDNAIEKMLQILVGLLGGTNIAFYYRIDDKLFMQDLFSGQREIERIEDDLPAKAYETGKFLEAEHQFQESGMTTKEFTKAFDWAVPLIVGKEVVGVVAVRRLILSSEELKEALNVFYSFAAHVLKNEILGYTRLRKAFDDINSLNRKYLQEISLRKAIAADLAEKQFLLDKTGEMAKVGGWELDPATKRVVCTKEVYRIHELPPDSQIDLALGLSFYAPEARPVIEEAVRKLSETGQPFDLELPFSTAKGRNLWVRAIGEAEVKDGNIVVLRGSFQDITDRKRLEFERERLISELKQSLAEVKTLKGMIPICASCKKIRDDKGFWEQIESYILSHSDARFTHGICPECMKKLYPDFGFGKETAENK